MPKKYDVFAEVIENAPCLPKDLPFNVPIYSHLDTLQNENLIKKINDKYIPIPNNKSKTLFKIIKYCIKNGLDYNLLLSKNIEKIVVSLFNNIPNLRPKELIGNKENIKILNYLEDNQFVLIVEKRPLKGIILRHELLENILEFRNIEYKFEETEYMELSKKVLTLSGFDFNPFGRNVFEFLSGSAQLEGGTVTIGETIDMIVNDIYPDKSSRDIQMVKNLNETFHYILEHLEEDIDVEKIKELNRLVMFSLHRNAGKYKKTNNKIRGNPNFKTLDCKFVPEQMIQFVGFLKNIKTKEDCLKNIGYIHNEFQHIHPFADGNSRTTRMLINWILLRCGLPILVLKMGSFDEYMKLTKLSKVRDDNKLSQLIFHLLLHESLNK